MQNAAAEAELVTFPLLAENLPGPPPASLDPVLDATIECISRHGLTKTSLSDIARELGVAPSTVYRKVGSVENAAQLVMAREGHRLLERMPEVIAGIEGPRVITVFLAECIETTRRNPMVDKIMRDEIDWVGRLATRRLEDSFTRSAESSVPRLTRAMEAGYVREQDPLALGHWIARITFTCLLAPPPGDLLVALDAILLPVLDPAVSRSNRPDPVDPRDRPDRPNRRSTTVLDSVIRGGTIVDGTGAEPFTGDVAILDGRIVAVGTVDEAAREEIDADGALVTPGFLDLHTHYDGQVTWDDGLEPSATNGITTVVLGNCGVGFAPVRPADHEQLIDMMEGVEDIPGAALTDGMPWGEWETFADYLDVLDGRRYAADVACHIAHGPVRYYVMGERAYEDLDATPDEVAEMARIVEEAFDAGAAGFSSNRFRAHMSRSGKVVPGTFAAKDEIGALAAAAGRAGHGVIQAIADGTITPAAETDEMPELDLLAALSIESGRPLTFSTFQASKESGVFRRVLDGTAAWNDRGAQLRPQIIPRAVTFMTSLATYHPFMNRPTYKSLADIPLADRAARMRLPEVRDQILGEQDEFTGGLGSMMGMMLGRAVGRLFSLAFPVDYEPDPSQSVKALARAQGVEPLDFLYDRMTEGDGTTFFALLGNNFDEGTLEPCREMLLDPNSVSGLSDAGAHVMMISDCSSSTFHLTHWVRDRTRGDRVPLEVAVHKLTGAPAEMYGFADRGVVGVGRRADLNVIDFDNLTIQAPYTRADLPTGASRILQPSTGYLATMVAGDVVRRDDEDTAARPGRLVRSRRRDA